MEAWNAMPVTSSVPTSLIAGLRARDDEAESRALTAHEATAAAYAAAADLARRAGEIIVEAVAKVARHV